MALALPDVAEGRLQAQRTVAHLSAREAGVYHDHPTIAMMSGHHQGDMSANHATTMLTISSIRGINTTIAKASISRGRLLTRIREDPPPLPVTMRTRIYQWRKEPIPAHKGILCWFHRSQVRCRCPHSHLLRSQALLCLECLACLEP